MKEYCPQGHKYTKENTYLSKGLYKECKKCRVIQVARYYKKHPEERNKDLEYFKEYSKKHPEQKLRSVLKWQAKNSEKVEAHKLVHKALKLGKLKKKPCKVCGEIRVDGHHPDYNKPLKVMWLCRLHHKAEHRRLLSSIKER